MLYPVGDGRLLGLGHEVVGGSHIDSGLRLSHFDVSNLANPVQLDSLHSEGHMESLYDQNALYYDPTESRIGLPWFGPLAPVPADSVVSEGPSRGANFYVITPGEMTFEKHISHQQFIPTECWGVESHFGRSDTGFDIQRIINVNKEIYAVSPFGLTVYGRDLSQPKSTLIFQDGTRACAQMISAYMPRCGTNELPPAPPIRE